MVYGPMKSLPKSAHQLQGIKKEEVWFMLIASFWECRRSMRSTSYSYSRVDYLGALWGDMPAEDWAEIGEIDPLT